MTPHWFGWRVHRGRLVPPTPAERVMLTVAGEYVATRAEVVDLWVSMVRGLRGWYPSGWWEELSRARPREAYEPAQFGCPYERRTPGWLSREWVQARQCSGAAGAKSELLVSLECPPWVRRATPLPLP